MQLRPYLPLERTLLTPVSVEECLRRLRDNVIQPWPLSQKTGIAPIKRNRTATRDQLVFRTVDGSRIRLHLEHGRANNRYVQYVFGGSITRKDGATTITGQYHLQRFSFVGLTLVYCLAAVTLVVGGVIIAAALRESAEAWRGILVGTGLLVGAIAILWWIPSREAVIADETLVIESLKRLLDAQAACASANVQR